MSGSNLDQAVHILQNGGVIICPTETLPGLSCLPDDQLAINRILAIKQRSPDKGLILIASTLDQFSPWIKPLSLSQIDKINTAIHEPTTWLVPHRNNENNILSGIHPTLAIRITSHPVPREICNRLNSPLVSTSINLTGRESLRSVDNLPTEISQQVDMVVKGNTGTGQPSRIIHIEEEEIVRG